MSALFDRPVHLAHVSLREEILLIRKAKEQGLKITCEVAPHHLFLDTQDVLRLGSGYSDVRPRLATPADQQALWDNLEVIDCFATDHAPHTIAEKLSDQPPPGFPGLESALPLLMTAVNAGRLTLEEVIFRLDKNPRQIFNIPEQPETWVEIDTDDSWMIQSSQMHSRCGWTPFEGTVVRGRVSRVVLRGKEAFKDGIVLADVGSGQNIRQQMPQ
jgi:carbamoyl-phosphate synthase/aspartate carbamoyltransferase/dihydroorotase